MKTDETAPGADGVVLSLSTIRMAIDALSECIKRRTVDGFDAAIAISELIDVRAEAERHLRAVITVRL